MSLWTRIKSAIGSSPDGATHEIRVSARGFTVVPIGREGPAVDLAWSEVRRIRAYKLDLLTTDCICLLFEPSGGGEPVEISEEWPGFVDVLDVLGRHFPDVPHDWYVTVMTPAFERTETVLYDAGEHSARP